MYDGDTDAQVGDHPWAVSTANFAELYYRLAKQITSAGAVPLDDRSASFFRQIGVDASTTLAAAAASLRSAGDCMLQAVVFHSDHLELSEQFDATSGYEKSRSQPLLELRLVPVGGSGQERSGRVDAGPGGGGSGLGQLAQVAEQRARLLRAMPVVGDRGRAPSPRS